jgi:hypothetical protein
MFIPFQDFFYIVVRLFSTAISILYNRIIIKIRVGKFQKVFTNHPPILRIFIVLLSKPLGISNMVQTHIVRGKNKLHPF